MAGDFMEGKQGRALDVETGEGAVGSMVAVGAIGSMVAVGATVSVGT